MLELEAHVVRDLSGALDGGRYAGLREVDQLPVMSEVLDGQLRMSIQTQPACDQPVEMADEKVSQIERARLRLAQLREGLGAGEELITVSAGNALNAFFGEYGVKLATRAAFAISDEEGPIAVAMGADFFTDRRCDTLGPVVQLCRQASHVDGLPVIYPPERGNLASQRSACNDKNAATRIHLYVQDARAARRAASKLFAVSTAMAASRQ